MRGGLSGSRGWLDTAAGIRTDPESGRAWVIFKLGAGRKRLHCDDHLSHDTSSPIHWYDCSL